MIGLFKEQERQTKLNEEAKQRVMDRAMKDYYKKLQNEKVFNETLFKGETIKNNLERSTQKMQDKMLKEGINCCEQSLSKELGNRKQDGEREIKMRQFLWETSPELRELRQKLLIADVSKDQAMQIAEKRALSELKKKEQEILAMEARCEKERYEEEGRRNELEAMKAKLQYHRDLDALRHYKRAREMKNKEQVQQEINAIDEIKKQIEEEDFKEAQMKLKKQKELKKQAQELKQLREEIFLREKLKDKAQDLKADEYRKAQELRAKEQEEKKQLSFEQKLQLQEKLLCCLERVYSQKQMQDTLRTELAIEEKEAVEKQKDSDDARRKMCVREELERLYEMQMYLKKQKEATEKKAEELYRQTLMAKLYEADKLDLMSQQKQHVKKLEHMRAVQAMIEENRAKKAAEQARELADQKFHDQIETRRIQKVNEEKIRFLRDHACELLGYLPKGILEDEKTIELLGEEFKKFYYRESCNE